MAPHGTRLPLRSLVSAAAFSIGWRHQAQRDNAAQTALAAATARTHRLEQRITAPQASLKSARGDATSATAAEKALTRAGTQVGADATDSVSDADSISSGAGSVTTAAGRIASELKTLDTYLTTTRRASSIPATSQASPRMSPGS